MAAPDIGACISLGFAGWKKDPVTHIVVTLLIAIVGGASSGILTGPMMVGYMRMIKKSDEGGKLEIGDVFKGFADFVPALVAVLVSSIIVTIGFIFCVLPGLLIMALIPVSAYLVAVGDKDGISALGRAWDAVKGNLLMSALCTLVLYIIGSLGFILCGIGVILTMPIAMIGMYYMAQQMTDGGVLSITQS
ncbi:hypothetical protein BH11PSE11_BH11PSE11_14730 [soil metagenome]